MPKRIPDVNVLQQYLTGVIDRAEHHAPNVDEIALAVAGAIVWRKDREDIKVFERDGEMKNVLWAQINGAKYAFSYNHMNKTIEVRKETTQGKVLASFSNSNSARDVKLFFQSL